MTANGLALYYVVSVSGFALVRDDVIPWTVTALGIVLAMSSPAELHKLILRSALVTLPLAAWLTLIWIGVNPDRPATLLLYQPAKDTPGVLLVAALGTRFFALALLTFASIERARRIKPSFVLRLAIPRSAKIMLLAAASFTHAFVEGVRRAHTALVAANVITARRSAINFKNGWLLIRSSWISALGIATERLDTKWRFENLPKAVPFERLAKPSFSASDLPWLTLAVAVLLAQILRA